MDSNEALDYLKKMHEDEASQTSETASTEDNTQSTAGTGAEQADKANAAVPDNKVDEGREPPKTEETETKPGTEQNNQNQQRQKPSKQEQINHAFTREKKRHKAEIEAKDKRIAELEEKLKKYGPLEQGDFDPNDVKSYIDHKFALKNEQDELDTLKRDRDRMVNDDRMREASERHERQVNDCYKSQEEQERYWTLLRNGGAKFREFLNEYDDGTIDAFIGDSDIAPVMISTLMRNPDVLRSIVEKQNPTRKMLALQQLENRLTLQQRIGGFGARTEQAGNQPGQAAKSDLPIIGSQVASPGVSGQTTKRDWNRYLEEHPY